MLKVIGYALEGAAYCTECADWSERYGRDNIKDYAQVLTALDRVNGQDCGECGGELAA